MRKILALLALIVCMGHGAVYAASNPSNIPAVASMAALKAIGLSAPQYPKVYLSGYYGTTAYGDERGGGIFVYAASCPVSGALKDDGAYVSPTGDSTGCYVRTFDAFAYPEQWGMLPAISDFSACPATDYTPQGLKWAYYLSQGHPGLQGGLYNGAYCTTANLDIGAAELQGMGVSFFSNSPASVIKANASGITMFSGGVAIRDVTFYCNENNFSDVWGVRVDATRMQMENVNAFNCDAGIVLNRAQNGTFINVYSYDNLHGLALYNGARNNTFYNFQCSQSSNSIRTVTANDVGIYFVIDQSAAAAAHGINIGEPASQGNDQNRFYGGVCEDNSGIANYVFQSANVTAYTGVTMNKLSFDGYEFDGGTVGTFNFDNTWTGTITLCNENLAGGGGKPVSPNPYGRINFCGEDQPYISGSTAISQIGIAGWTNFNTILKQNLDYELTPTYTTFGTATVAYNSTTKTFTVTGASGATSGVTSLQQKGLSDDNYIGKGTTGAYIAAVKPVMYISGCIVSMTGGGSNRVQLAAELSGSPFRENIALLPVGCFAEMPFQTTGGESGALNIVANDQTGYVFNHFRWHY